MKPRMLLNMYEVGKLFLSAELAYSNIALGASIRMTSSSYISEEAGGHSEQQSQLFSAPKRRKHLLL